MFLSFDFHHQKIYKDNWCRYLSSKLSPTYCWVLTLSAASWVSIQYSNLSSSFFYFLWFLMPFFFIILKEFFSFFLCILHCRGSSVFGLIFLSHILCFKGELLNHHFWVFGSDNLKRVFNFWLFLATGFIWFLLYVCMTIQLWFHSWLSLPQFALFSSSELLCFIWWDSVIPVQPFCSC